MSDTKVLEGLLSLWGSKEGSFLCLSTFWCLLTFLTPISTSVFTSPSPARLSLSYSDTRINQMITPSQNSNLMTSAKTLSNKVTFTGSGEQDLGTLGPLLVIKLNQSSVFLIYGKTYQVCDSH